MYKIPKFWRRFQLLAQPTVYHVDRRLQRLVSRGQITKSQAMEVARHVTGQRRTTVWDRIKSALRVRQAA